jgi:NIMA (never in mitosis gene a)-related kinase
MEYADDGDLQAKINKKRKEQKYFNENLIWLYSIQMIEGLKALHNKKIMHRDLKSANIFLTSNKNQCKLGDMNVSKVIKEKFLTTQTGTPYYASPEVWRDEPYSYKSDLWSIGCVIYEMCALRPPFNGKDLDELFENVCKGKIKRISGIYSDELWEMILMLLQNDVEKRVDCNGFLNSEIIQNKIKELKDDPRTNYEGNQLDKNKDLPMDNNILLETINFKNIDDLKIKLPRVKNYENNNTQTNKILENNNSPIIKSKNNSINVLITN